MNELIKKIKIILKNKILDKILSRKLINFLLILKHDCKEYKNYNKKTCYKKLDVLKNKQLTVYRMGTYCFLEHIKDYGYYSSFFTKENLKNEILLSANFYFDEKRNFIKDTVSFKEIESFFSKLVESYYIKQNVNNVEHLKPFKFKIWETVSLKDFYLKSSKQSLKLNKLAYYYYLDNIMI